MRTFARAQRRLSPRHGAPRSVYRAPARDSGLRALLRAPPAAQRACADCEEEKKVQRAATPGATRGGGDVSSTVAAGTASGGAPLPAAARGHFESRFDHDFGAVRVHTGPEAAASALELNAHAYTFGKDVVFGAGQYDPGGSAGQRLLAHELTHVVQQTDGDGAGVRRQPDDKPKDEPEKDPLCASVTALPELPEEEIKQPEQRHAVVRILKIVRRCGTADQHDTYRKKLAGKIGDADAKALWDQAGTAFGGHVGMYPEFAPDMKRRLEKLGASETVEFGGFDASGGDAAYRRRASAAASGELADLERTDILYFRGHQYAQYGAPGVFTSSGRNWVDLRYVEKSGGFANVKLMISTSCATICKEALEVFATLFPNAVLLGYRKSAPRDNTAVRNTFEQKIQGLKRGLLLDQSVDVDAIVAAWKATIEAEHAGDTLQLPGYLRAGTIEYWDGKQWHTVAPLSEENKCRRKRDHEYNLPAPQVQRAASAPARAAGDVSGNVAAGTASGGAPLPGAVRSHFEPRFGHDFGAVRVHSGPQAAASARELNAHAYTFGRDVVFGAGQYDPGSAAGRRLLAHELAHVVQQSDAPSPERVARRALDMPMCEPPEKEVPDDGTVTYTFASCSKELCEGREGAIDADLERALSYTARTVSALEGKLSGRTERLLDWFFNDHSAATADKVRELLGHVQAALQDTRAESRYVCSTRDAPIARTGGADKWCVDSRVPICLFAPYFGDSARGRAVTLIHEAGHRIGLSSAGNEQPDVYDWTRAFLSLSTAQSLRNTDSYANFASAIVHGEPTTLMPFAGAQGGVTSSGGGFGRLRGGLEIQHPEFRGLNPSVGATLGAFDSKFIASAFVSLRLGDARPSGKWSVYADLSGGLAFIAGDKGAFSPEAEARLGVRIGTLDVGLTGGVVRDRSEEAGARTVYTGGLAVSWLPDFFR